MLPTFAVMSGDESSEILQHSIYKGFNYDKWTKHIYMGENVNVQKWNIQ